MYKDYFEIYEKITSHVAMAEQSKKTIKEGMNPGEIMICPALRVALDYLYIGDNEKAEQEFRRIYDYPDAEAIWQEVMSETLSRRPLYRSPAMMPSP